MLTQTQVYLLLGANLGDRESRLSEACQRLTTAGEVEAQSAIYQTDAWGDTDQPPYLNQVLRFNTSLSPLDLLKFVLAVEKEMGRVRQHKWEARTIDIDLLYYGRVILTQPFLTLPHPHIQDRKFVLVPMNELDPDFIHPIYNLSQRTLLERCKDKGNVLKK